MLRRYFRLHVGNLRGALARIVGQPFGSLLTILVIAIALALPAGLAMLVKNAGELSAGWEGAADFTVYLDLDVPEERAADLRREIEAREDVAMATLIPKSAGFEEFKRRSGFGEALAALKENPLPDALVVRPAGGASGLVESLAAALEAYPETALVQVDTEWVARLRAMLVLAGRAIDIVTALLAVAVAVVIGNTIRLEINNRSTEIEVTKLVGGTDGFIRRPFLYLGLCYGFLGALMAAVLVTTALWLLGGPVRELADLYATDFSLAGLRGAELGRLLGSGALLGWAGAWLAAARHLRAIEPG